MYHFFRDFFSRVPELLDSVSLRRGHSTSFADFEIRQRRLRELRRLNAPTEAQVAEKDALLAQAPGQTFKLSAIPWFATKRWVRSRGRILAATFLTITVVIALPTLAFIQASQVLGGKQYIGGSFGIFNYYAIPVRISPSSESTINGIRKFDNKALFLLGQNTQYAILYAPTTHSTVRIPVAAVVTSP
jgi:hypothetical protein